MSDKSNDPIAMWQNMLGEMGKGFNAFANQAMASPELSKAANQAGDAAANMQKQFGDLMEQYLASMNLPNREQMISISERMASIEAQLNEIKALLQSAIPEAAAPKPRTRRPPPEGGPPK
jgi:BMFP domain-containing protein YqiC